MSSVLQQTTQPLPKWGSSSRDQQFAFAAQPHNSQAYSSHQPPGFQSGPDSFTPQQQPYQPYQPLSFYQSAHSRAPASSVNSSIRPPTGFAHEFVPNSVNASSAQKHDEAESAFYCADIAHHASIWDTNLLAEELSVCSFS